MERLVGALQNDEIEFIKDTWSKLSSPLRIATVCSGTDSPILALDHLKKSFQQGEAPIIQTEHVFSCENVKFKRDFIIETSNPTLIFNDVTELSSGSGVTHDGTTQDVPRHFDVLIAGTECVDFSSLSTSPKGLKGGGRSDITFHATRELAKEYQPSIVILENVDKCPAKEMKQSFGEIDYVAVHHKVCTSDYFLPQSRNRAYFLFLHKDKARFRETEDDWVDVLDRFGRKKPPSNIDKKEGSLLCWTKLLQPNNHATNAKKKKKGGRAKPLSQSLNSKWLAEIKAIEKKEGLTPYDAKGGRPYSDATKDVAALQSLPDRAKMRLDVQCKRAMKAGIDPFKVPLLWNPAQQLRFTDAGFNTSDGKPRTIAPCVTPKHEWIVSSQKRPLTGAEALALQGITVPKKALSQFDCGQLRDLAGNAMSTTVVASVFLATLLTVEMISESNKESPKKRSRVSS